MRQSSVKTAERRSNPRLRLRYAIRVGADVNEPRPRTGGTVTQNLSARGARILMLCRDTAKAAKAAEEITQETGGQIDVEALDLASLESVRECAAKVTERCEVIDILINNAGIMTCPNWKTKEGFDMQFGTNHLGHFLLTELLLPLVRKSGELGNKPR